MQVFNSRTCQLVLGAGALAAAGLRSITAKHLAMATQCVGAVMALHPTLTAILTGPLPHARRAILLPDFERLLQVRRPDMFPTQGLFWQRSCGCRIYTGRRSMG